VAVLEIRLLVYCILSLRPYQLPLKLKISNETNNCVHTLYRRKFTATSRSFPATARLSCLLRYRAVRLFKRCTSGVKSSCGRGVKMLLRSQPDLHKYLLKMNIICRRQVLPGSVSCVSPACMRVCHYSACGTYQTGAAGGGGGEAASPPSIIKDIHMIFCAHQNTEFTVYSHQF